MSAACTVPTVSWPQLRANLALAIVGFASRDGGASGSIGAAVRLLDALSEPDGPLPALRTIGATPPLAEACPAWSQVARPFTDAEIASICLSRRHDFGLLPDFARLALMAEARSWEQAFAKERETTEVNPPAGGGTTTTESTGK
ncbi:hypothetical protein [Variovorax gossypii]